MRLEKFNDLTSVFEPNGMMSREMLGIVAGSLLQYFPICPGGGESAGVSSVRKKKTVRFGGPLAPEFFDKTLPPSTPLQKGATPARAPTPGHGLLRPLLKTPQRSESKTHQAQPDLASPSMFGASPTFSLPRSCSLKLTRVDREEKFDKVDKTSILIFMDYNSSRVDCLR